MSVVIQVEDLSKQYRLGKVGRSSLSHDINRWWHTVRGKEDPYLKIGQENDRAVKGSSDYVWSLRDINFEVKEGEVLGIIGRNGAGKSTLLKILSKVTAPTLGNVKLAGRVASLLEVGTGFHPELSGRDNIYLNGAILGMTRNEISKKFDEIVDFAGVERYIDTPVKRYSSGMYVRLAFAVAAHLEPEILIVDEVLAVGDAEFQKKCLGKMKDVSVNNGRTVLFVSHQLGSVAQLCTKAMMLMNGKLVEYGDTNTVIKNYLGSINTNTSSEYTISQVDKAKRSYYFENVQIRNRGGELASTLGTSDPIYIGGSFVAPASPSNAVEVAFSVLDHRKNRIFTIHEPLSVLSNSYRQGRNEFQLQIDADFLTPGSYSLLAAIHIPHMQQFHLLDDVCKFNIVDSGSRFSDYEGVDYGVVYPRYSIKA
ncbi:ABC transporter ATP-binding protein [Aridibaculum aurantiacum]|uniref:ABC transporter ATP-binding protein n=1 Tax=Aridibaculum aurantiacum TaxID=2810307 RepID=UPI001A96BD7F|nr:ABC transporter ATP-binding protein [Aridibaculum aurantiacum]